MAAGATCILDTAFGNGAAFLRAWQAFAAGADGKGLLHYVGLIEARQWPGAASTPALDKVNTRALALEQALNALSVAGPPRTGFYRLPLQQGRVLLTLCVGPRSASLAQLALQADHMALDSDQPWTAKELHRLQGLARRGTTLAYKAQSHASLDKPPLDPQLWKLQTDAIWVFEPAWALRNSRKTLPPRNAKPSHCTVIGAGISGALVARALALRGWQVTVLEQAPTPAAGASGLPAGLVSVSGESPADPLAGISHSAYHLTRHLLHALLVEGVDWQEGGATQASVPRQQKSKNALGLAAAMEPGSEHSHAPAGAAWRPQALWLKPQALVRACMATPGVALQCSAAVHQLRYAAGIWLALDAQGQPLASSPLLVLCNAMDAPRLLNASQPTAPQTPSAAAKAALGQLHPRFGSISLGPAAELQQRPALPVQGQGHFLPAVPGAQGLQWMAGAGFDIANSATDAASHQANLARVAGLVPHLAEPLQAQYHAGQLGLWRGQRCVSHDRLPLVGTASADGENGLWMCLAMGARGLTWAALCAELLAARLAGEPLPLPQRVARLLDAQRLQSRIHPSEG